MNRTVKQLIAVGLIALGGVGSANADEFDVMAGASGLGRTATDRTYMVYDYGRITNSSSSTSERMVTFAPSIRPENDEVSTIYASGSPYSNARCDAIEVSESGWLQSNTGYSWVGYGGFGTNLGTLSLSKYDTIVIECRVKGGGWIGRVSVESE